MSSSTKLNRKCEQCKYKDSCDNKRLVACANAELPKTNIENSSVLSTQPLLQPLLRKHTSITIKMGEYGDINTSLEEIAKNINQQFVLKLNKGYL